MRQEFPLQIATGWSKRITSGKGETLLKKFYIACLPADGIGPEVIASSRQILEKLTQLDGGIAFNFQYFDWSSTRYQEKGALMPEDGLQQLEQGGFHGILLGPVGSLYVPDHITLWGLLLPIRQGLDQYVNLRPLRLLEGIDTPFEIRDRTFSIWSVSEKAPKESMPALADVSTFMSRKR